MLTIGLDVHQRTSTCCILNSNGKTVKEKTIKGHVARWKNQYNHRRPHSSLGYVPPAVFAAAHAKQRVEATPHLLAALASAPYPQHTTKPKPTLITAGR